MLRASELSERKRLLAENRARQDITVLGRLTPVERLTAAYAADGPIYFCDPHSPWQRGTNENMNGLLRQYFPKGSDLSVHTPERLAQVAAEINSRPRKTLGWKTPSQLMATLLQPSS